MSSYPDPAPILVCYDGSEDAAAAIVVAGQVLSPRRAIVLTVWEPVAVWEPYDPATILSAPMEKLAEHALGMDDITRQLAEERATKGVELATQAGLQANGRIARGKASRAIREVATELEAEVIVLGARGLGRVGGMLLGSVSSAVAVHANRPVLIVPHQSGD